MKIWKRRKKCRRLNVLRHKMRSQITPVKKKEQMSLLKTIVTPTVDSNGKNSLLATDAYGIRDAMVLKYLKQESKLTPEEFTPVRNQQGNSKLTRPLGPLPRDSAQAIEVITTLVSVPRSVNKKEILKQIELCSQSLQSSDLHGNPPTPVSPNYEIAAKARLLSKILYVICRMGQRGKDVEKLIEFRENLQNNVDPSDEVFVSMARLFSEISAPREETFPALLTDAEKILNGEVEGAFRIVNSSRRPKKKKKLTV